MEPVRREDKKSSRKIRTGSPKRGDLDSKGLRETFGRLDYICKYFYKSDFAVKKMETMLYNQRFLSEKLSPSVKSWFISCSFWKLAEVEIKMEMLLGVRLKTLT